MGAEVGRQAEVFQDAWRSKGLVEALRAFLEPTLSSLQRLHSGSEAVSGLKKASRAAWKVGRSASCQRFQTFWPRFWTFHDHFMTIS